MSEEGDSPGGFVTIATVYSLPEASVLAATLRAYGIEAITLNQGLIAVDPMLTFALGGMSVAVPPGQYDEAIALLEELDGGWTLPPNPIADGNLTNGALSVALAAFGAVGSPRLKGRYAWRSGLHPRPEAEDEAES